MIKRGNFQYFSIKSYVQVHVHVMQDAQDDRSKLCLNYVTKEPNVIENISRKFYCCVLYIVCTMLLCS